jgi:acyl-CoA thioester hydrolase
MKPIEYHDTTVRVRYAETDQMGVVYHANYLVWFEVGRVELLRALGVEYKKMETEDDCHIVVGDAHCRYQRPAKYDDLLRIRTRVAHLQSRTIEFAYEVFRESDEKLLTTGETKHVICDKHGKAKSLPAKYRAILAPHDHIHSRATDTRNAASHGRNA